MRDVKADENIFSKIRFIYKILFLVYALFLATDFSRLLSFDKFKIFIMIAGVIILSYDLYTQREKMIKNNIILVVFALLSLVSIFINKFTFQEIKLYMITIIQLFLLNSFESTYDKKKLKQELSIMNLIVILTTFSLTLWGLILRFKSDHFHEILLADHYGSARFNGFYLISTGAGMICYISIVVAIVEIIKSRKSSKGKIVLNVFYGLNILVQLYAMIKTEARGGLISLAAFFFIFIFLCIKKKKSRRIIAISIAVLIALFPIYKNVVLGSGILTRGDTASSSFSSGRLQIWQQGYEYGFKENVLFGSSVDNLINEIRFRSADELYGLEGGRIHNIYLDVLYSNGILGFIALMSYIAIYLSRLYKKSVSSPIGKRDSLYIRAITAFLCSMMVLNIVESLLIYTINLTAIMFWVYMGYGRGFLKKI